MSDTIQIEVVKGPGKGKVFQVPAAGFTIGRSPEPGEIDCALMEDVSVSRRHAKGRLEAGKVVLEDWPDCPSKAGLVAGGRRVPRLVLEEGGNVTVGRTILVFRTGGAGRRSPLKLTPVWRRWLMIGAAVSVTLGGAVAWGSRGGGGGPNEPGLDQAWSARCSGDLEDAIRVLSRLETDTATPEAAALKRECRRVAKLFETPRRLEESLRLDEARDAWAQLALGMKPDDPLRTWVETGCVDRLTRQLASLRP